MKRTGDHITARYNAIRARYDVLTETIVNGATLLSRRSRSQLNFITTVLLSRLAESSSYLTGH